MEVPLKVCETCKFRDEDQCKRKHKSIADITQSNCIHCAPSLYYKFIKFYNEEWIEDGVYQTKDFVDVFGISRHLAQHYLYKVLTLDEHKVFRVKKHNKSYYIKRTCKYINEDYPNLHRVEDALSLAEQMKLDGLKIRIDK